MMIDHKKAHPPQPVMPLPKLTTPSCPFKGGKTVIFQHDTQDKPHKHTNIERSLTELGHEIVRSKMYVGDITLLNNQSICIDLKQDLNEVAGNLTQHHERFRNECLRAKAARIKLIALIEEENLACLEDVINWESRRHKRWMRVKEAHEAGRMLYIDIPERPPIVGAELYKIMVTMSERYGIEWQFARHDEVARRVCEILGVD